MRSFASCDCFGFRRCSRSFASCRLALFAARFADGLVNRYAKVFNRNIILWELTPTRNSDQRTADKLSFLRDLTNRRYSQTVDSLERRRTLEASHGRLLVDLDARIDHLPSGEFPEQEAVDVGDGVLLVEDVVAELVTITPERLNEQMGPPFSESVARFVRMFDLPGVRSLPVLRDLTSLRSRGAGEIAAAAVNKGGRFLQRLVASRTLFRRSSRHRVGADPRRSASASRSSPPPRDRRNGSSSC